MRSQLSHAKADANLEVAWVQAEAAERKQREAAGGYDPEAARRARRLGSLRQPVSGRCGGQAALSRTRVSCGPRGCSQCGWMWAPCRGPVCDTCADAAACCLLTPQMHMDGDAAAMAHAAAYARDKKKRKVRATTGHAQHTCTPRQQAQPAAAVQHGA